MRTTVSVREAQASLDELVHRVERGSGPIWLSRGRARKAVLVDVDTFESLVAALEDREDLAALTRARRTPRGATLPMPYAS